MTTMAYHHKDGQIAVDSRTTRQGGTYDNNQNKIHKVGNKIFIMAGTNCDMDLFVTEFKNFAEVSVNCDLECSGIMIEDSVAWWVFLNNGIFCMDKLNTNHTIGSGGDFALSAMDFGRSAKEAVKYASTKDVYTGGRIRVINLK